MTGSLVAAVLGGFPLLSALVTPDAIYASDSNATVTSGSVTTSVSGGSGTFSYAWSVSHPIISATTPSSNSTQFTASLSPGSTEVGTATCTVSDSLSGLQVEATCYVELERG